jgi:hypothetical protein
MALSVGPEDLAFGFTEAGLDHLDKVKAVQTKCVFYIRQRAIIGWQFDHLISGAKAALPVQ